MTTSTPRADEWGDLDALLRGSSTYDREDADGIFVPPDRALPYLAEQHAIPDHADEEEGSGARDNLHKVYLAHRYGS